MEVSEENLNVMLAELLAERGLKALGEVRFKKERGASRPDVLVILNGIRIIIEGKRKAAWDELISQCERRLDEGVCDVCVMIEYVDIFKLAQLLNPSQKEVKAALLDGKFNLGIISYVERGLCKFIGVPVKLERYENVSFSDLLAYILSAYERIVKEDVLSSVVDKINETLEEFAESIASDVNDANVKRLKEILELREKEGGEYE